MSCRPMFTMMGHVILSAKLMLDHLGNAKAAAAIHVAIARILKEAKVKTPDLGGKATTAEMADAVIVALG